MKEQFIIKNVSTGKEYPFYKQRIIEILKKNCYNISWVENPTDELKYLAINEAIKHKRSRILRYVENPTEKMQEKAVKNRAYNILYVDNPSENIILLAFQTEWSYFIYARLKLDLDTKSSWFRKEFNKLKLKNGPIDVIPEGMRKEYYGPLNFF